MRYFSGVFFFLCPPIIFSIIGGVIYISVNFFTFIVYGRKLNLSWSLLISFAEEGAMYGVSLSGVFLLLLICSIVRSKFLSWRR